MPTFTTRAPRAPKTPVASKMLTVNIGDSGDGSSAIAPIMKSLVQMNLGSPSLHEDTQGSSHLAESIHIPGSFTGDE